MSLFVYNRHREVFKVKSSLEKKWSRYYKNENCLHLNIKLCELSSGKTLFKVTINFAYCSDVWNEETAFDHNFVTA